MDNSCIQPSIPKHATFKDHVDLQYNENGNLDDFRKFDLNLNGEEISCKAQVF